MARMDIPAHITAQELLFELQQISEGEAKPLVNIEEGLCFCN